jgi:biopolymer transport protein ExbD
MSMARRSILDEVEEETEINLSPMIDCIFILLIFFIVTTVFVDEQGIQVAKPDTAAAALPEEQESFRIEITPENKVLLEGKETLLADVGRRVKASIGDGETPVVIRAHEKSGHGTFVAVWDAAKLAGAKTLSFNTVH